MKIIAVIVTYNRKALLRVVLDAVSGQSYLPDIILVIDNKSTDGTSEYLKGVEAKLPQIKHILMTENLGGAGGFHYGMKHAYELGADWIWVLDDDATPKYDALEKLITSEVFKHFQNNDERLLGFLASRVDWTDGSICQMNVPNTAREFHDLHHLTTNCCRIITASFVSILVNREALKTAGYPVKEFFIWFDDVEHTRRITEMNNTVAYYIPDSVVIHQTPTNLFPMDIAQIDRMTLWKYKYGIRNELSSTLRGGPLGIYRSLIFVIKISIRVFKHRKFSYFFPLMFAAINGITFNYKKFIEIPEN